MYAPEQSGVDQKCLEVAFLVPWLEMMIEDNLLIWMKMWYDGEENWYLCPCAWGPSPSLHSYYGISGISLSIHLLEWMCVSPTVVSNLGLALLVPTIPGLHRRELARPVRRLWKLFLCLVWS
jgi:hypothetical protein